jgi:hypothetical protein
MPDRQKRGMVFSKFKLPAFIHWEHAWQKPLLPSVQKPTTYEPPLPLELSAVIHKLSRFGISPDHGARVLEFQR